MDDKTPIPLVDLRAAPLPTDKTARQRRSLVAQLGSFIIFNLRMLWLITRGDH